MKELNEKLAKWAGFERRGISYSGVQLWIAPDEIKHFDKVIKEQKDIEYPRMPNKDKYYQLPNFTESLDACFKWLVPKVTKKHRIEIMLGGKGCSVYIYKYAKDTSIAKVVAEPEPLASVICKAIEKLIELKMHKNAKRYNLLNQGNR